MPYVMTTPNNVQDPFVVSNILCHLETRNSFLPAIPLQAGWNHQDGDTYVTEDVSRSECSSTSPGESHGICDGFGTCQCAPPFIGDDCSIKAR